MVKVDIETSIVSYLTARPSSNLIAAAWQKETTDWWESQRHRFSLCVSDLVIDDALHIAIAAVHGVGYLLTWNCRHIANAETRPKIRSICLTHGFQCPEIATPTELMGVTEDD